MDEKVDYNHTYEDVLKAVGFEVLAYEEFGSYSGEWAAVVKKPDDNGIYAIASDYGSCSVCDLLQKYASLGKTFRELYDDLDIIPLSFADAIAQSKWSNAAKVDAWLKKKRDEYIGRKE